MVLGLKRGTIKLVDHTPLWIRAYEDEVKTLKDIFGPDFIASAHIGSTAIPTIQAKPILDMMVALPELDTALNYKEALEDIGYHYRGMPDVREDHHLFAKGDEDCRTIYLKLTVLDGSYWENHLLFRDYLLNNPQAAKDYEALKFKLAASLNEDDRKTYTASKADFIQKIIYKARQIS